MEESQYQQMSSVVCLKAVENTKYTHRYKICGYEIEHVFEEKYLGVVFDPDLSFKEHICEKVRKANCLNDLIRRSLFVHRWQTAPSPGVITMVEVNLENVLLGRMGEGSVHQRQCYNCGKNGEFGQCVPDKKEERKMIQTANISYSTL